MTRVYHPGLNDWRDVPDDKVTEWTDAGWLTEKPGHVDDSAYPEVEAAPVQVPVTDNTPKHVIPAAPITDNTPSRRAATTKG